MRKIIKILFAISLSAIILVLISSFAFPLFSYFSKKSEMLYSAIDNANKIVITKNNNDKQIIYSSMNSLDIQSFRSSLHIKNQIEWALPSCRGQLGISLYKNNERLARIAYLTNDHIRVNDIQNVGYIAIEKKFLLEKWFQDRNISIKP